MSWFGDSTKNIKGARVTGTLGEKLTNALGIKRDSVAGNVMSGDLPGAIGSTKSHASERADTKAKEMEGRENESYGQNQTYADQLHSSDVDYQKSMQGGTDQYLKDLGSIKGEIEDSQKDAGKTYSNQIQPRLKSLMEGAQRNSAGAMSLQDAMDPNNKVATQTRNIYNQLGQSQRQLYDQQGQQQRDLYNKQGQNIQGLYENQAQNEGRQGLADVGVLSALGMQNMAGQLGNVPMTGGQLQALMGANQAQSGAAYAQTQRRLQSLRDQGLAGNLDMQNTGLANQVDLQKSGLTNQVGQQNRGVEQGFSRSDSAYQKGLNAQDRYRDAIGDYEGASDRQLARDQNFRNQRGDISGRTYDLQSRMSDINRGVGSADTQRRMTMYNAHVGGQQANTAGQIAGINAGEQQRGQMIGGGVQALGTAAGAYFGGPAGAAAGGQAGKAVGDANMPQQTAVPGYSHYGDAAQMGPPAANDYAYSGNGAQMGPPAPGGTSYAGSSPGSMGAQGGLGLADDGFRANPYAYAGRVRRAM